MSRPAPQFRLGPRGLMIAVVSAAFAAPAWSATAGRVDFAIGNVTATGADGKTRTLTKGAEILSGDRILTNAGRAQIRFLDGAYVSLQPDTDFSVREYRYDGKTDGTEKGVFGLLKGALRTVTGLIGRVNKDAYQIQTPTATIGIRGTGGIIQVLGDGTTRLVGTSGTWFIRNPAGTLDVPAGQAAQVSPDPQQAPQQVSQGPVLPPTQQSAAGEGQPGQPGGSGFPAATFATGEVVNSSGEPAAIQTASTTPPLPLPYQPQPLDGFYDAVAFSQQSTPFTAQGPFLVAAEVKFDPPNLSDPYNPVPSQGKVLEFASPSFASPAQQYKLLPTGTAAEQGVAFEPGTVDKLVVAWGRWIGDVQETASVSPPVTVKYPSEGGLHYVVGLPTLAAQLPAGASFTYNFAGGTAPTDGFNTPGAFTGSLVGDFTARSPTVAVQGTATVGTSTYTFQGTGIPVSVATSNSFSATGLPPIAGNPGNGCFSGCSTALNGAFYGQGASHAGLVYNITGGLGEQVTGAAVFKR